MGGRWCAECPYCGERIRTYIDRCQWFHFNEYDWEGFCVHSKGHEGPHIGEKDNAKELWIHPGYWGWAFESIPDDEIARADQRDD